MTSWLWPSPLKKSLTILRPLTSSSASMGSTSMSIKLFSKSGDDITPVSSLIICALKSLILTWLLLITAFSSFIHFCLLFSGVSTSDQCFSHTGMRIWRKWLRSTSFRIRFTALFWSSSTPTVWIFLLKTPLVGSFWDCFPEKYPSKLIDAYKKPFKMDQNYNPNSGNVGMFFQF